MTDTALDLDLTARRERSIYWKQTLSTAALVIVFILGVLLAYTRQPARQYLGLAAVGIMLFAAHLVSWSIVRETDRYRAGIWIVAIAQLLAGMLVLNLMDAFWLLGPFLLVLIPFEISLVDDPHRLPYAFVCSLLGVAGMLVMDLWLPIERVQLQVDLRIATPLIAVLLVVQLLVQIWLFWTFRLRDYVSGKLRLDLTTELALVFSALAGAAIILVMGVLLFQIRDAQIAQVGEDIRTLALINAERIGNTLGDQVDSLSALGRQNAVLQEGLQAANAVHESFPRTAIQELQRKDRLWTASPDNSDLVLGIRSSPQAIELSKFRGVDLLHNNVMLVDRLGGLVASQGRRPQNYYFGETEWFQAAWSDGLGGVYLGSLTFEPAQGSPTIFVAVAVLDPQTNQTVGVLASTYSLAGIQREIRSAELRQNSDIALVDSAGRLLGSSRGLSSGQASWGQVFAAGDLPGLPAGGSFEGAGWRLGRDDLDQASVLAYAPLNTSSGLKVDDLRRLNWLTVVTQTRSQALSSVNRSIKVTTLVGALLMVVIVIAAVYLARLLTRPIEALTTAAVAASRGDLEQRAKPDGPVELVSLAEAFNALTSHLQLLINSLQDQVAERTRQLQARADELATLNRVTAAVASERDMRSALQVVAREMVQLFTIKHTAIALLNKGRNRLKIVSEYNRDEQGESSIGMAFTLNDSAASSKVIDEQRTLTIDHASLDPQRETLYELLQRTGTHSLMIVPLLARGEVIGTIDITCSDPDRNFTPSEVELAETIAGQIAGAIDNARLFSLMQEAKETAEAANAAKSDFLANVSHELRTPLTSVMGFARIVKKRLQERIFSQIGEVDGRTQKTLEQIDQNLDIIVAEGERLTELINNVLDLSKIEAGKIEWQIQPVHIAEVITHAAAATVGLLEQKGDLELAADVPADLPLVLGDRNRLVQVVINLISNAVKFTAHGTITCKVRELEDEILVRVSDTGIGIASEDHARVFEKFTQLGDTLTEKPQGTGLGLPITREIVESHGGRIWMESEPGHGSTFFFTLPIYRGGLETTPAQNQTHIEKTRYGISSND